VEQIVAVQVPVELIERARTEREAFEQLVARYNGFVLSLVRARGADEATADDVSQEVWQIIEREISSLREVKAFLGWLARITENAATAAFKCGNRETALRKGLSERRPAMVEPPPESAMMLEESHMAVLQALRALPEDYRIPVVMRYYEGMTAREIAEVLDAPIGTILSRLFRANHMLRDRLKKHFNA
jgi:RNA polymerase sigma-70 factor (ECF subfamily)